MHNWNYDRAADHIDKKLDEVKAVEVVDYKRDTALENIPTNKAYRLHAVHCYADILNLDEILGVTDVEGPLCHKRTLRFLNLHFRAVARIMSRCDMRRVDFHNQRLHGIVTKPYGEDDEGQRIHRAVAVAQLIVDVLDETGDDDEQIPNAIVRVGVDSGEALAVNNGRSGGREPLFLGEPANHAAKLAAGRVKGIFLSANARAAIDLPEVVDPKHSRLTADQIAWSQEKAALPVTKDQIVKEWREDLEKNPIGAFEFSRHTPPLRTLDISSLTPKNSRRQEAVSLYADLDGFTAYVAKHIDASPEAVVRTLHVLRAELDRALTSEFDGRKIRFIGDCIHGLLCEGTTQTTDSKETVTTGTLCAGALRSSFNLALQKLAAKGIDTEGLGLQIGFDFGPMTITRLGLHGDRVRCSVSRGVLSAEAAQLRCLAAETAIGPGAYEVGSDGVKALFGEKRKVAELDYNEAVEALSDEGDEVAVAAKQNAYAPATPAVARASTAVIRPHAQPR